MQGFDFSLFKNLLKYMLARKYTGSANFSQGTHLWNSKNLAFTLDQLWDLPKNVMNSQINGNCYTKDKLMLTYIQSLRKHPYSTPIENFTTKNWKFSDKKFQYFSYFCSIHRLWVLFRTASMRQWEAVLMSTHNLCFWAEIRTIMYTHINHSFTI